MFTPIGDDNSDRSITPYVNYLLIAINIAVFILLQGAGSNPTFTYAFASVPAEILTGLDIVTENREIIDEYSGQHFLIPGLQATPIPVYLTLVTSMFMHSGFGHLIGNLLYLWVFGDNLENRMGHTRYLLFFLLTGVLAALAHVFSGDLIWCVCCLSFIVYGLLLGLGEGYWFADQVFIMLLNLF